MSQQSTVDSRQLAVDLPIGGATHGVSVERMTARRTHYRNASQLA